MKILKVKIRLLAASNNHMGLVEPGSQLTSALPCNLTFLDFAMNCWSCVTGAICFSVYFTKWNLGFFLNTSILFNFGTLWS